MITRDWVLEQIKIYQTQKENALAIANANQGAIEAMELVLKQLEEKQSVEEQN